MNFKKLFENKFKDGVYISVDTTPGTTELLSKYVEENNIPGGYKTFHTTLIFSQKEHQGDVQNEEYSVKVKPKGFHKFGDYVVILLDAPKLTQRHEELMKEYDFRFDYDEFTPHISLTEVGKDFDISSLPEIDFELEMFNEHTEPLDLSWSNS